MQVKKQELELDMEQQTGSKSIKAVYCHPAYLAYMQSTSWETLGWKKHKLESRLPGEIWITSDNRWHHLYGRKWRRTKEPLNEVKEESEKVGLKLNIQKIKILASGPITSWQIDGETMRSFILGGSKITADGDYSHEIKRCLLLGRKAMTNLDSILKSRDVTLPTKVHLVKAMVFFMEKTLESPLDCKKIQPVHPKGNQSWILIERSDPETETPMLWPPDAKNWLIWKDSHAGKDWGQEEKGMTEDEVVGWRHWLDGHEFEQAPGVGDGQGSLACCSPWDHSQTQLSWTELKILHLKSVI